MPDFRFGRISEEITSLHKKERHIVKGQLKGPRDTIIISTFFHSAFHIFPHDGFRIEAQK